MKTCKYGGGVSVLSDASGMQYSVGTKGLIDRKKSPGTAVPGLWL
jgi:hypothetical protein